MAQKLKGKSTIKTAAVRPPTPPAPVQGSSPLSLAFVSGLAEIASREGLSELKIRTADAVIIVRRGMPVHAAALPVLAPANAPAAHPPSGHAIAAPPVTPAPFHPPVSPPPGPATTVPAASVPPVAVGKTVTVTSPFVGTFYSSPGPDSPPFVEVGQRVKKGHVLCIVEAMKLMNEIEAELDGTVVEALVANAQPVEYGQALYKLTP